MSQTFLSTRDLAVTGALARFSSRKAIAYLDLVLQVRRERRQLRRLSSAQLVDLGLDARMVAHEVARGSFDLPKSRMARVEREIV